jgi:predicted O-linked N-acetylglucosamine transferase (SPINDLY family)
MIALPGVAQQEKQKLEQQRQELNALEENAKQEQQQANKQKQQFEQQREKIESQRIAFITQELDLTPAEAQAFWPVYNEYDKKRHELNKQSGSKGRQTTGRRISSPKKKPPIW